MPSPFLAWQKRIFSSCLTENLPWLVVSSLFAIVSMFLVLTVAGFAVLVFLPFLQVYYYDTSGSAYQPTTPIRFVTSRECSVSTGPTDPRPTCFSTTTAREISVSYGFGT
jgi:hypothetical protein